MNCPISRIHPHAVLLSLLGFDLLYWHIIFKLVLALFPAVESGSLRVVMDGIYALGLLTVGRLLGTAQTTPLWLKHCGLIRQNLPNSRDVAFICHGIIIGVGIFVIPWILLFGGFGYFERSADNPYAGVPPVAILLMPIVEETVFTGFLYGAYRSRLGIAPAILLTTAAVFVTHIVPAMQFWLAGVTIAVTGIVACLYREFTGSLWPSIASHMAFNACFCFFTLSEALNR